MHTDVNVTRASADLLTKRLDIHEKTDAPLSSRRVNRLRFQSPFSASAEFVCRAPAARLERARHSTIRQAKLNGNFRRTTLMRRLLSDL